MEMLINLSEGSQNCCCNAPSFTWGICVLHNGEMYIYIKVNTFYFNILKTTTDYNSWVHRKSWTVIVCHTVLNLIPSQCNYSIIVNYFIFELVEILYLSWLWYCTEKQYLFLSSHKYQLQSKMSLFQKCRMNLVILRPADGEHRAFVIIRH